MLFEAGDLYHIYNQGNNRIPIFFSRENYLFFLEKISKHILPHADIIAWCLMPNHFHLMIHVNTLEVSRDGTSNSTPKNTINKSIGILQASYTRAINKQENRTGSLFRIHTHAECLTKQDLHTPSFFDTPNGAIINRRIPEKEYPQVCFNYIHNNPVAARMVKHSEDWEFSSFSDYAGLRNGKLINRKRAEEFGLIISESE